MKVFIYFILIIAFLIFYQQNPVFAVILVALFLGVYLFFKARKSGGISTRYSFLSGSRHTLTSDIDEYIKFLTLQTLINRPFSPIARNEENTPQLSRQQEQIIQTKEEIIKLLTS